MVVVGGDAGDGRQKGKSRVNFERTIFFDTRVNGYCTIACARVFFPYVLLMREMCGSSAGAMCGATTV
jgi:hypothetical protein